MKKLIAVFVIVAVFMATVGCNPSHTEEINYMEMTKYLLSSQFKSERLNMETSRTGLSDPWNVGVDKEAFDTEVLYEKFDGMQEFVINAATYGVNGTDKMDDSVALNECITAAKSYKAENPGHAVRIVLPEGDLDFIQGKNPANINYAIDLTGCKDLILEGKNTNLYMYGDMSALYIGNSENILIKGVNVDWGRVPFSVGEVVKRADNLTSVTVKVNQGYKVDEETVVQGYLEFDQFSYLPRENGNDVYPANIKGYEYLGDNTMRIDFINPVRKMPVGTLAVLRHKLYENDAIYAENSKKVYFESVNIYSAPGMGLRAHTCDDLYLNRFNTCLKPGTDRLMSVTADGVHTIDCKGDLKVTNCLFENRGDDALNTHGMYLKIGKKMSATQVYAFNPRGYHFAPEAGDSVEITDPTDLSAVQTLKVKSVAKAENDDGFYITFESELSSEVIASMTLGEGYVMCNPSRSTKLYFANNIVRNSRCRGILIQTREATVVNNTFANMSDCAILMTSDTGDWYESLPSANVVIRNNKIIGNNRSWTGSAGEITAICFGAENASGATGLQNNIEISNNFIANGRKAGLFLNSVGNVKINNNLIHNVGTQSQAAMYDTAMGFTEAVNVEIIDNVINPNSGSAFKPAYIGNGADAGTFTVSGNKGLSQSDITPEVKEATKIAKVDANITVGDYSLAEWENIGTEIPMVGKTDVDQEIVFPEASDFSNTLKIAWTDEGIYYAYSVTDDNLRFNDTPQYWYGDGVETFLCLDTTSLASMGTLKSTVKGCMQMFNSPSTTGCLITDVRSSDEVMQNADMIQMTCWLKADGSGYEGEVFIPFEAIPGLKEAVTEGKEIAFCVNFYDVDDLGKQISVSNADAPVENNKFVPGRMPKIILIGG